MTSETPAPADLSNQMLKDLQSWWEIPSIAQYISLFRESFNLPEIEIEELEKGLIDDSTKGPNSWLQDLILSLLRSLMPGRVNKENCEIHLQKLIARKWPADKENLYTEEKSFSELTLRTKVEIIYSVCLYRLDRNDIAEVMKSMDADALRVQKLGIDDIGNTYWYFYGTRLYMEENCNDEKPWDEEWKKQKKQTFKKRGRGRPKKIRCNMKSDGESEDFEDVDAKNNRYMNVDSKSRWSVVCDTIEEWVSFAEKFKSSKSKNEKALFQIVQENFLPTLNKIYEEKEKKLQQKIRELMPIREKIVTRRETRKIREFTYDSPIANGYSDEAHKLHIIKDRARRLEERNKRASETKYPDILEQKRRRYSEKFEDSSHSIDSEASPSQDSDEYNYALTPKIDGLKMDLQSQMERLISSVKLHKDAWPFLYPVNEDDAPGYFEIIKDPIDLSTIESRLHKGVYETVGELDAEFSQMVSNCELYNGESHGYSKMVQTLWKMFRKGVSKILDYLPAEENSNSVSEESNSTNSDSAEYVLKSPHIRKFKKDNDEKRKEKKKKKKQGMEALEMLAQASEEAVKNTNSNGMLNELSMYDEQKKSNYFSDLKIFPINSHPPSLIEKFSSESSNESVEANDATYDNCSSYLNEAPNINEQFARSSPNEVPMSSSESPNLLGNHLTQLTNFIEKHNVLSNSDVSNVLSDGNSSHPEHSSSPGAGFSKDSVNSDNLDNGLNNILDDCNGNVSNILSQISKQMYNSDNQLISKDINSSYLESLPKQDIILSKNARKTPPNSNLVVSTTAENMPLVQGILNVQPDLGSPSSLASTVDATVLGISQYNDLPKKLVNPCVPLVGTHDNFSNNEIHQNLLPSIPHERVIQKPIPSYQLSPQLSPNELFSSQQYGSSNLIPNVSYQSLNFDHTVPICRSQMSFPQPTTTTSNVPLQISASYPKSVRRRPSKIRLQPQSDLMEASTGDGQFVVVTDVGTNSGVTYHLYTQSKMNQSGVEEFVSYVPSRNASTAVHVSPKPQNNSVAASVNQESVNQSSPPQKKCPVPQQFQSSTHTLPPRSSPYSSPSTTSSIIKTSLPVTSSNFIPVSSFNVSKNKPTIMKARAPHPIQTQNVSTSFNASLNPNESLNATSQNNNVFQALNSKSVPLVYSGFSQPSPSNQTDLRFSSNQGAMAVQSNICMSNGVPIVQQVLIPADQQPIQVQGGGQFVYASPQNTVNRVFNSNPNQMQNNVRQLNHGFAKVLPQIVTQNSVVQLSKDVVQGLQLQAVAQNGQTYTQVAQNPQFVNIPTYMITNQNQVQAPAPQTVMNMQQYQLSQRTQMQINGQGNG